MIEKLKIIKRNTEKLGYSAEPDLLPIILEKYISMGGGFSLCGATNSPLHLELDDRFHILDNIVYSQGLEFTGFKKQM